MFSRIAPVSYARLMRLSRPGDLNFDGRMRRIPMSSAWIVEDQNLGNALDTAFTL